MIVLTDHLPILPVAIPLFTGALILLTKDTHRLVRLILSGLALLSQLWVALQLLSFTRGAIPNQWPDGVGVYLLGSWQAPFGIVAVVDRLAVIMLLLTAILGMAAWLYALARWDRRGVHFHALLQFLLMGLNGAFLTGDLFNLFVFFEVLLVASYGLMLHGSGRTRVAAGLHYIAVNLIASFILLIALAIIYGLTGTLNMADLTVKAGTLAQGDQQLLKTGIALLSIAFLIKAAAWPMNFWLPTTYANSSAPVAGVFAIMTKVGIYALLRIGSLLQGTDALAAVSGQWMFVVGLTTLAFASIGLLAAAQIERQAGYGIIMSSGILLSAFGYPGGLLTGPALFYLISSVLALGAFYLLVEMIHRTQPFGAEMLAASLEMFDLDDPEAPDQSDDVIGIAIPAAMAFLGMAFFACALLIAGIPPLSGFVAKFALISYALEGLKHSGYLLHTWLLVAGILLSGLAGLIALTRTGIRLFWSTEEVTIPRLRVIEASPVAALITGCIALTIWAGPVMNYLEDTAHYLQQPEAYVGAVLNKSDDVPAITTGEQP